MALLDLLCQSFSQGYNQGHWLGQGSHLVDEILYGKCTIYGNTGGQTDRQLENQAIR